ncbi:hypothetical protein [Ancylobacter oerskovii]|uniref:Uncharacterized protein n=1 Tax=Ancylobacter oerskovii TaxID=459519 RepID=A0ABW4YUT1_9HYPH|nr:hypothetical protein [Ancylobacter oerskovii]MBS7544646.1 hypothetical protein [Ancylobacter oerskovii]
MPDILHDSEFATVVSDGNGHLDATVDPTFMGGLLASAVIVRLITNRAANAGMISGTVADALLVAFGEEAVVQLRSLRQDPAFVKVMVG